MVPHRSVQPGQVVQALGIELVVLAQRGATDLQGLAEEGESGDVISRALVQHRQVVQAGGIARVVFSEKLTSQVSSLGGEVDCLLIAALMVELRDPLK